MRTDNHRSPAEAGVFSQTTPTGSDAVLGRHVFDPRDIPFLPLWPEMSAVFPRFAPAGGLVAGSDTHGSSEKEMSCVTNALTGASKCL